MFKKNSVLVLVSLLAIFQLGLAQAESNMTIEADSDKTLEIAQAFLWAAGSGDMQTLDSLMADDFAWNNEGDSNIPWIGNWQGKEIVFSTFLPRFSAGIQVTSWTTEYSFVNGDQAVFMGSMSAITTESGVDTGKFNWAVRVQVEDGKVASWNWFEDSYAVSKAFNAQ